MRSSARAFGRGGEAVHDAQRARVGDARRLRQAGGAGGVDEQRRVLDRQRRPLVGAERLGRRSPRPRDRRAARRSPPRHGRRRGGGASSLASAGGELRQEMRLDDRRLGADDGDRMGERWAGEIGVDQRRRHAGARHAEPDRDIFRAVGHHQADRVALAEPLRARPARVAVGARVELAVGERLGFAEQSGLVAVGLGPAFEIVAERQGAVFGDRPGALQRAQDAAGVGDLALQSRQHADVLSLCRSSLFLSSCMNQIELASAGAAKAAAMTPNASSARPPPSAPADCRRAPRDRACRAAARRSAPPTAPRSGPARRRRR